MQPWLGSPCRSASSQSADRIAIRSRPILGRWPVARRWRKHHNRSGTDEIIHQSPGQLSTCIRLTIVICATRTVRLLPQKLQRLLGYYPFGSGVDGRDPLDGLHDGVVVHPDARLAPHWRGGDGR